MPGVAVVAEQLSIEVPRANDLKALVDLLDRLSIHSFSLHATDRGFYGDRTQSDRPAGSRAVELRLTIVGRTFFEQVCDALRAKPTERMVLFGQRSWWAEADNSTRRLLIEGVSFQHHDDWEPRHG